MAMADYRQCDVCGHKAFYDARLNYADGTSEWHKDDPPFRVVGKEQYDKPELNQKYGLRVDYLGDWAVICSTCAKTHKCVILPIEKSEGDA